LTIRRTIMSISWSLKFVSRFINIQIFLFLLLIITKISSAQVADTCNCATIDFETIPGDSLYEGLVVNDQYSDSLGFTFILEDSTYPHIAKIGQPITAFESAWGDDTPAPDQNTGFYFLTDDGLTSGPGITSSPLIINFSVPVDSASGMILDIDASESFKIQARDDTGGVLQEVTISTGEPGTGDGLATPWSIKRENTDIYSIKLEGSRTTPGFFGLGFDNFTSCSPLRAADIDKTFIYEKFPSEIKLYNNYPNPFNPQTSIVFELEKKEKVLLKVFNSKGQLIKQLLNEYRNIGKHTILWDASELSSGIYFINLQAGQSTQSVKALLLK
jgi:hypothetical protein